MSQPQSATTPVLLLMLDRKMTTLISFTRLITVAFTFFFVVPIFDGYSQYSCYQKALISNAATCALRLHQRWPRFQLNYDFFKLLVQEDSAHYLIFSLIFLMSSQLTLVLLPISLFAIVNLLNFYITILQEAGYQEYSIYTRLVAFKSNYQPYMLQMIALAEITLLPIAIFGIFTGSCQLLTPFIYSRFLIYRYASRRNPYTRLMFADLKFTLQRAVYSPSCPLFVRNVANQFITLVSRFAPPIEQSQQ